MADDTNTGGAAAFLQRYGTTPVNPTDSTVTPSDGSPGGATEFLKRYAAPAGVIDDSTEGKARKQIQDKLNKEKTGGQQVLKGLAVGAARGIPIAGNDLGNMTEAGFGLAPGQAAQDAPIASSIGGLVGGTVPYLAAGAVPALARGLGMAGPTMLGRIGTGMVGNGLVGAADASSRGENPYIGAAFGSVAGAVAPVAGEIAGGAANALSAGANRMLPTGVQGLSRSAANVLGPAVAADDPASLRAGLNALGSNAMLLDVGNSMKGLAQGLVTTPGAAKSQIMKAIQERAAGSNDRVNAALKDVFGPSNKLNNPDPLLATRLINEERARLDKLNYPAVHAQNIAVDIKPLIQFIDDKLPVTAGNQKSALSALKKELTEKSAVGNPGDANYQLPVYTSNSEKLHNARMELDKMINYGAPGMGVEQGAVKSAQGSFKRARDLLDESLKTQVAGMREADEASAALARRAQAVEEGTNAINGVNIPHPYTFGDEFAKKPPGEKIALGKGMHGEVDRAVGAKKSRNIVSLNNLLQGNEGVGGFGAQNMATVFGDAPVSNLLKTSRAENAFSKSDTEIVGGAQSAQRLGAKGQLEKTQPGEMSLLPLTMAGAVAQTGKSLVVNPLIRIIMENPQAPRNLEMAMALTKQGLDAEQVLTALDTLNRRQGIISNFGRYLNKSASRGTNALTLGAGATNRISD